MHLTGRTYSQSLNKKNVETFSKLESKALFEDSLYLNQMKYSLDLYKSEIEESIKTNIPIPNESFKKNFFSSLETLIHQVINIKDKKLRETKIETIFKWYEVKLKFFKSLNPIDTRTDKNFYEKHPNVKDSIKSDYYEAKNYVIEFEKDHRTEEFGVLPPKDR